MSCDSVRASLNEFLDQELGPKESNSIGNHLANCIGCQQRYEELRLIGNLVSERARLPEASQNKIRQQIRKRERRSKKGLFWSAWDGSYTYCRDLDRAVVWSKLGAVPIALVFFLAIGAQFAPVDTDFNFLVLTIEDLARVNQTKPVMHTVQVRRSKEEMQPLLDVVWKMPYEDSMALVAEISPEGTAEIEDILEYPRSQDLFDAVDQMIHGSEFKTAGIDRPHVIISFQKIDVYDHHQKGL